MTEAEPKPVILWYEEIAIADVANVGGKNASLGEIVQRLGNAGLHVPAGIATTARALFHWPQTPAIDPYRGDR
ncbi:PEP/pyruvate-binding domain-containing protein [Novosphingobium mathurense]|uniref:PEP/pyruvate-binding domain-containing protein n=1 Tax=Novosphingobium mathurense TaxID=428990 RepID=UPI0009A87047|nr:PEP/pyruvate-binding domain-containing protein [Novosphingobium mathurense]